MKVASITSWGSPPETFSAPDLPEPNDGQLQLRIMAVGLHRLVRGRAAGTHPSARGARLPFDPSVDGVGLHESSRQLFYINAMTAPLFSERANVGLQHLVLLGHEGEVDPIAIAALVNPVSSSWMALRRRIHGSVQDLTVLILGVTSASGRAAVQVAQFFGASRILGVSRSAAEQNGVHKSILLPSDGRLDLSSGIGPVDVVLDYIGGRVAAEALATVVPPVGRDLQYVHLGDLGGEDDLPLSGSLLNAKAIRVMGCGMGSWNKKDLQDEVSGLVHFTAQVKSSTNIITCSLSEIGSVWKDANVDHKTVLIP